MTVTKALMIILVLILTWLGLFAVAIGAAFFDLVNVALVAAFGMLLIKVALFGLIIWWVVNVAFSVAEWSDERRNLYK